MPRPVGAWDQLTEVNWLDHHWPFSIRRAPFSSGRYEITPDGQLTLATLDSSAACRRWIKALRKSCLAEIVARHADLAPVEAIILANGSRRLGRIKPELWGGYDAIEVSRSRDEVTILSAKARAAFPDHKAVFIRLRQASR